ncbi:hypothetical protein PQX77_005105 [Marasmius sp. AFHP31]|nr:hypothetical protein PQX77_005105 [Marasmius sp. AFHP31]
MKSKLLTAAVASILALPPSKLPAVDKKYRRRFDRPVSQSDKPGHLYALEGMLNGKPFIKIGRSVNPGRRFKEHKRSCKAVEWEEAGTYPADRSHRAESLVHIDMKRTGFVKFKEPCSCKKDHLERFYYPGLDVRKALKRAKKIMRQHRKV